MFQNEMHVMNFSQVVWSLKYISAAVLQTSRTLLFKYESAFRLTIWSDVLIKIRFGGKRKKPIVLPWPYVSCIYL